MLKQIILEMIMNNLEESKSKKDYYVDKNGISVIQVPMSFATMKSKLEESSRAELDDDEAKDYSHISKDLHKDKALKGMSTGQISDHLHKHYGSHVSDEDSKHIKDYTDSENASSISKSLIQSHRWGHDPVRHLSDHEEHIHDAIQKNAKPSQHEFHLHTGVSRDLGGAHNDPRNKDGLVHSPAHISATHDLETASHFAHKAGNNDRGTVHHMMRIKIKKGDKILHVSRHSDLPEEHETIIPAGTTLKHIKTTLHHHDGSEVEGASPGKKYKVAVHHYEIHHQD